jgi:glutamine synthetase
MANHIAEAHELALEALRRDASVKFSKDEIEAFKWVYYYAAADMVMQFASEARKDAPVIGQHVGQLLCDLVAELRQSWSELSREEVKRAVDRIRSNVAPLLPGFAAQ